MSAPSNSERLDGAGLVRNVASRAGLVSLEMADIAGAIEIIDNLDQQTETLKVLNVAAGQAADRSSQIMSMTSSAKLAGVGARDEMTAAKSHLSSALRFASLSDQRHYPDGEPFSAPQWRDWFS
jgi:hypothetical protein